MSWRPEHFVAYEAAEVDYNAAYGGWGALDLVQALLEIVEKGFARWAVNS